MCLCADKESSSNAKPPGVDTIVEADPYDDPEENDQAPSNGAVDSEAKDNADQLERFGGTSQSTAVETPATAPTVPVTPATASASTTSSIPAPSPAPAPAPAPAPSPSPTPDTAAPTATHGIANTFDPAPSTLVKPTRALSESTEQSRRVYTRQPLLSTALKRRPQSAHVSGRHPGDFSQGPAQSGHMKVVRRLRGSNIVRAK